jgi:hypothetical protein
MLNCYSAAPTAFVALLFAAPLFAAAQGPSLTSVLPLANSRAASRTGPVTVTSSQPLLNASAGALKVHSQQRGGSRTAQLPAVVSGNTLTFTPTNYAFKPGETIEVSVTKTAASSLGQLAKPYVAHFTTAVGGTGRGTFTGGSDLPVNGTPYGVAVGDIDGNGSLDVVAANSDTGTLSVLTNASTTAGATPGSFTNGQQLFVNGSPGQLKLRDIDNDGDLDLLVPNQGTISINVRLNGGDATGSNTGVFANGTDAFGGPFPNDVETGDIDGDGDLDLVVGGSSNDVFILLNGGDNTGSSTGLFTTAQLVTLTAPPSGLALVDVDHDGDLDLLAGYSSSVAVRLNGGNATGSNTGIFSGQGEVYTGPVEDLTVGDIDGDGDADLLIGHSVWVYSWLNNGQGVFSSSQTIIVGSDPFTLALGDVDADGDLDLVTANYNRGGGSGANTLSLRLNNGSGYFSTQPTVVVVGSQPADVALGDVDGDNDLDIISANSLSNTVSIRLNGGTGVLATAPSVALPAGALFPNPAHAATTLSGLAPHTAVMIKDALGRAVRTTAADATGMTKLALADLPVGLYFVQTGGQTFRLAVE